MQLEGLAHFLFFYFFARKHLVICVVEFMWKLALDNLDCDAQTQTEFFFFFSFLWYWHWTTFAWGMKLKQKNQFLSRWKQGSLLRVSLQYLQLDHISLHKFLFFLVCKIQLAYGPTWVLQLLAKHKTSPVFPMYERLVYITLSASAGKVSFDCLKVPYLCIVS